MSRFKIASAGIAVLLAAMCVPAFGQSSTQATTTPPAGRHWGFGPRFGGPGGPDGMMLRGLNLTSDQQAQISQIRENHKTNIQSLMSQIQTKRQQLQQLEQGTTFDVNMATQILSEIAPLEANMMGERFTMNQEIQAVLTPDQKAKQQQLKQQFQQRMQERMQRFKSRTQSNPPTGTSL